MKRSNTNSLFQIQIEENLERLHKHKIYPHHVKASAKNNRTLFQYHKWNIIKRHIRNQQKQSRKPDLTKKSKRLESQRKPLQKDEAIDIISHSLVLQQIIMELAETVGYYRRMPMFFIFFQSALTIVFNAYNLVVYLLKMVSVGSSGIALSIAMLCVFHGFHILSASMETLISVMAYHCLHEKLRKTGTIMDEWNIYITSDDIKLRLSQFSSYVYNNLRTYNIYGLYTLDGSLILSLISGTTTYIIILIQYSGDGEICKLPGNLNNTRQ